MTKRPSKTVRSIAPKKVSRNKGHHLAHVSPRYVESTTPANFRFKQRFPECSFNLLRKFPLLVQIRRTGLRHCGYLCRIIAPGRGAVVQVFIYIARKQALANGLGM